MTKVQPDGYVPLLATSAIGINDALGILNRSTYAGWRQRVNFLTVPIRRYYDVRQGESVRPLTGRLSMK
jgi:hypothetical protein